MKPQDIIVLIKLHIWKEGRWTIASIANSIFLSPSETHSSIKRLEKASLYDPMLERPKVDAMEEFIIHGLRYVFPVEVGRKTRGVPTAHSADPMNKLIAAKEDDNYVWPDAKGTKRGYAIEPLYRTAPKASLKDERLHAYLALIDSLRIGKAREQAIAKQELIERIRNTR